MVYLTAEGVFTEFPGCNGLMECGDNLFRLSIKNKKLAFRTISSVFQDFSYQFVEKLGDYNVYEFSGRSPMLRMGQIYTVGEVLDGNLDYYLYDYTFGVAEMTNYRVRSTLYKIFMANISDFNKKIVGEKVYFNRKA